MVTGNNLQQHLIEIHTDQLFTQGSADKYGNESCDLDTIAQADFPLQLIHRHVNRSNCIQSESNGWIPISRLQRKALFIVTALGAALKAGAKKCFSVYRKKRILQARKNVTLEAYIRSPCLFTGHPI